MVHGVYLREIEYKKGMAALDGRLDELYQRPLAEFTRARNALAASLDGEGRAQVKRLKKPTVVPWAVDQLYWRARPVFDRLRQSGAQLREAQVNALRGREVDVRAAIAAHRRAVADAVHRAVELASAGGARPAADALTRMLEAVSLVRDLPEPPGRFTEPIEPPGFHALAGFAPSDGARQPRQPPHEKTQRASGAASPTQAARARQHDAARRNEPARAQREAARAQREAARREADARREQAERRRALATAERRLRTARAALRRAAALLERRRSDLERAARAEADARDAHARVAADASEAQAEVDRLRGVL